MPAVRNSLDPLFRPRSVAVFGASASPGSVGAILMRNLLGNPFGGGVYPINPKRRTVLGVHCYPDLAAVPKAVDLAVIATPAPTVPALVADCAARGVPAAIIISAGFSELGAAGRALEADIRAARGAMRLIGPNCLGVIHPPTNLNASFAAAMAPPGRVALLSQSGAICTSILDWALERHIGFSSFVSVGSMLDVDFADLIDYFGDDAATKAIILYMESIGDVRKFLSAARSVSRTKHVIVVKSGRHEAGARAAASHTGALAGSDAVFDAAFRRAGMLRVTTIPDLFNMSEILSMQPPPRGPALAVVTNAGGPGVMAVDDLMTNGGRLAPLAPETLAALNAALPPFWSHANPIDLLGDATADRYRLAVELCVKDATAQGVLILLTPQAMTDPTETARQVAAVLAGRGRRRPEDDKPVLACWMGGGAVRPGREILNTAGVPTFDAPEDAIRAFLHMVQYRRNQELLYETPPALPEDWRPDPARVRRIIADARAGGRTLLTEVEAKDLLAAYGLPVTPAVACRTTDEAVAAARRIGFPVVLKLLSTRLTHKSDVGGVQLNLADDEAVRVAFERVRANVAAAGEADAFEGATVQPMVTEKGVELIIGSSTDRQFGPVILFGAGGVLVEVLQDRALGLPPLNRTLARRLMERTRIYPALQGVRGHKPVDLEGLETMLARFSLLLADFVEDVQEVDMNPVLAAPGRVVALDARVLLAPAKVGDSLRESPANRGALGPLSADGAKVGDSLRDWPANRGALGPLSADGPRRLAIHPYPNQYTAPFRLRDGSEATVRAIGPEDEPLIVALHAGHSEHTLRMRFFSLVKTHTRDSLIRLCHLDYDREMALAAVRRDDDGPHMLGVSRYYLDPATGEAEFALVVGDSYQGKGLGRHLLQRIVAVARERGVRRLTGLVLRENGPMLALTNSLGFRPAETVDDAVLCMSLDLAGPAPA